MVELTDVLRLLYIEHFLCLPCIAARLGIDSAKAMALLQRLGERIEVKEVHSFCPGCAASARLFTLGDGAS
jgi:hypothetical protein